MVGDRLKNWLISLIRTATPYVEGFLVVAAARARYEIETNNLNDVFMMVFGTGTSIYAVVRMLEERVSARFGWLLGWAKQPDYPPDPPAVEATRRVRS